jgi:hypothetical protein
MPHDFLAALHVDAAASVAKVSSGNPEAKLSEGSLPQDNRASVGKIGESSLLASEDRHRTVGVSMSPALRQKAAERARALGLPFSRYVAWCVEAELEGRPPQARFERSASTPAASNG